MLVLTVCVQKLLYPLVIAPIGLLHRSGMRLRPATVVHFLLLMVLVILGFFVAPAAIFSTVEISWSFLDGIYFCFISLCTIGLGDFVPASHLQQKYRQLYQIGVMGECRFIDILECFYSSAHYVVPHMRDFLILTHTWNFPQSCWDREYWDLPCTPALASDLKIDEGEFTRQLLIIHANKRRKVKYSRTKQILLFQDGAKWLTETGGWWRDCEVRWPSDSGGGKCTCHRNSMVDMATM